jgi:glycosyltransferase involved in cell wall biosynthesis
MDPIKVFHLTWSADKAGMLTDLMTVQSTDPSLKIDVCFGTRDKGIFLERIERLGITPNILGMRSRYAPIDNLRAGWQLRKMILQGCYDIIHLQEVLLPFPFLAAVSSSKAKVVIHNRGEFNVVETTLQRVGQALKRAAYSLLVPNRVDRILCNSSFTVGKTPLLDRYLPKVKVLYNAVDLARIGQISACKAALRQGICQELGLAEDACIVAVAARLVEFKRIDRFIRAFAAAAEDPRLVALIAGDGPLRSTLERETARRGLGERVRFLGYRTDAKEIIASADLFVLPSAGEAFGIAALEAVALQVPVMLFADAGGPLEFVRDGVNGFVVADEVEMARQIGAFSRQEKELKPSTETNVVYDIQRYARKIRVIYNELLAPSTLSDVHAHTFSE